MSSPARILLAVFLASASACGGTKTEDANKDGFADGVYPPNNVTVITPTRPTGWVSGSVVDFNTGVAIVGAHLTLSGAGLTQETLTDALGGFVFGPVPASRYSVRANVADYTEALFPSVELPNAAGTFHVQDSSVILGPIGLLPTTGSFSVDIVSSSGAPVPRAHVTVETQVRFFENTTPRFSAVASADADLNGRATVGGLPNIFELSPRFGDNAGLVVTVSPSDADGDMKPDLRGKTVTFTAAEVRAANRPPVIVLEATAATALSILATNVPRLATPPLLEPAVLDASAPVRVVLNLPIDPTDLIVDLRDEAGKDVVAVTSMVGLTGNTLEIQPQAALGAGQEYNLYLRLRTIRGLPPLTLETAAPFFAHAEAAQGVTATAIFVDANLDDLWGNANDVLNVTLSRPIGRAGAGFTAQLWIGADINGSGVRGDGLGELPMAGALTYPPPIAAPSQEPLPASGSPASGFTRYLAAVPLALVTPLPTGSNPLEIELRFVQGDNGGHVVVDPDGHASPLRITGVASYGR